VTVQVSLATGANTVRFGNPTGWAGHRPHRGDLTGFAQAATSSAAATPRVARRPATRSWRRRPRRSPARGRSRRGSSRRRCEGR
jgi:hypothetical protein